MTIISHAPAFVVAHMPEMVPAPADPAQAEVAWTRWHEAAAAADDAALGAAMAAAESGPARPWLEAIFGNSPYLTSLALRDPTVITAVLRQGPDASLAELEHALNREDPRQPRPALMRCLRVAKRHAALIVGMADIGGLWPLERVTAALSTFAGAALSKALCHLLTAAADSGQIVPADAADPERACGVIILGMGKLGAFELNYSSDIDLIILYDSDQITYAGRDSVEALMTRLTRDLVRLMEERTADGYVFRTDLRLRPDPGSTPPAVSIAAAETYYASVGQNWERAALIKARPVAGDIAAGRAFLKTLTPFLWRKHLDFAAIQDIHSIKRQIDARRSDTRPDLAGHNVKLGHGGIREIEFFAQTQQLIWGGRMPGLRGPATVDTLRTLAAAGRIEPAVADDLARAYRFLRQVEHRLQMIDDKQTHSLPADAEGMRRLAVFLGYDDAPPFIAALRAELETVQFHFRRLFAGEPPLSADGNLVFTGAVSDPETLATLERLGFRDTERISAAIRGWHHGRIRATRSERARELLTELVPSFLKALGKTADPDLAFTRFDEFLSHLAAGVQLLSLFKRNPDLLALVAEIMGEAPLLAVQLARRPVLLDAVLTGDFFATLPENDETALADLARDLDLSLAPRRDYEDVLDLTRRWAADRRFQIGVQLLQGRIDGERAGRDFSLVTETVIAALLPAVQTDFGRNHGEIASGRFVVLALGKLGSREMNVLSDIDLIFVYAAPEDVEGSAGARPLPVSTYFTRLGQRLINALSAPTADGSLYDVDMRLRPSGNAGPIASSRDAFRRYYAGQAWTWEHMALTRARIIAGDGSLAAEVRAVIDQVLDARRDPDSLLVDVGAMRDRIEKAHPAPKAWDCKHRRGAIVDLEFIVQYLQLRHAAENPVVRHWQTIAACERIAAAGFLPANDADACVRALRFWHQTQQILRVSLGKIESAEVPASLLDRALTRATGLTDQPAQRALLTATAETVMAVYERVIGAPAAVIKHADQAKEQPKF